MVRCARGARIRALRQVRRFAARIASPVSMPSTRMRTSSRPRVAISPAFSCTTSLSSGVQISRRPSNSDTVAPSSCADTLNRVPLMTATRYGVSIRSLRPGRLAIVVDDVSSGLAHALDEAIRAGRRGQLDARVTRNGHRRRALSQLDVTVAAGKDGHGRRDDSSRLHGARRSTRGDAHVAVDGHHHDRLRARCSRRGACAQDEHEQRGHHRRKNGRRSHGHAPWP